MIICAVDQSFTGTGVAIFVSGELKKYFQISTEKDNTKLARQKRIEHLIHSTLLSLIKVSSKDQVHFVNEGIAFGARGCTLIDLAKLLGGIQSRVADLLTEENMHEVPPTQWKKFLVGSGKADKRMVIDEINKRYKTSFDIKGNNICDAIGIGLFQVNEMNK